MVIHTATNLSELETIAMGLGLHKGCDFSFCARLTYNGVTRVVRSSVKHRKVGRKTIADIVPATYYDKVGGNS